MRPRILLFFEYGTLNGGEFSLLAILQALKTSPFEFVAAAPIEGLLTQQLEQLGIQVHPLILRDQQGHKHSIEHINKHLLEIIQYISPDLVHSNSLAMGRMVGRIAPQLSIPCTAHLRDIIKLNAKTISDLNQNTGLVAVSKATQQFHVDQGLHSEKVQVIYNGIDTERFRPRTKTGQLKQSLGLSNESFLIANIGQICLRKGQTVLAQAVASLAREFPQINTLIIGQRHSQKHESIANENNIRSIFAKVGLDDRLFCLGTRDDIPMILNEIDLLVHTAHQEPLGRVLLEAAASAQAIVATDVGGTAEILTHQQSALLVRPNDPIAVASAIRQLITHTTSRQKLGHQAHQTILDKFSLSAATSQTVRFWESFL